MNNNLPLVTVLICAYNAEKYIEECLEAILKQTYTHLDILLINDGSNDNTLTILNKIAQQDKRIRIVNNETNLGFIASLNKGLKLAEGKYIAKTDSDDVAEPQWIEKIIAEMEQQPEILAMGCDMRIMSETNNGSILALTTNHGDIWKKPRTHQEIMRTMLYHSPINNPTAIMRTDIYKKYGLTFNSDYVHAEDYKFWFEVSKLGKLANYPEPLLNYRLHQNQVSSKYSKIQKETALKIKKETISYYLQEIGLKINLSDKAYFEEIYQFHKTLNEEHLAHFDILNEFLFIHYMSLEEYKIKDLLKFLFVDKNKMLTFKQKRKVFKRFLFQRR